MNRKIIFRAWDKRHKKMYPFELIEIPYSENVNLDGQFDGLIDREYVFMQYTGLVDKNNVEVFNQDIVKIKGTSKVFEVDACMIYGFILMDVRGNAFEYSKNPSLLEGLEVITPIKQT